MQLRFKFIMKKTNKMPMQKNSTPQKKADLNFERKELKKSSLLQPGTATLQKILQFASSYRAERIAENQYIEWYLN